MTSPNTDTAPSTTSSQAAKAATFHALHTTGPLVLPNAWDVASAVIVRDAGARTVATTSAGASWSLGTPDGEQLDRDRAIDLIARIVALIDEPVTADLEAGYGNTPDQVAATARAAVQAGAVGINLEDTGGAPLREPAEQAERIAAVRAAAEEMGVALFINARTDVYLAQVGRPQDRSVEAIGRAQAYLAAGADGIFVPGVADPKTIRALVEAIPAPLNIMAGPGAPTVSQLADLGVRRISVGMAIAQAAYAHTRRAAAELLTAGTYTSLDDGLDYAALNGSLTAPTPR